LRRYRRDGYRRADRALARGLPAQPGWASVGEHVRVRPRRFERFRIVWPVRRTACCSLRP